MFCKFFSVNKKSIDHFFIDNNTFRLLARDASFWDTFWKFFEKYYPEASKDKKFIFTWSQMIEAINLGSKIGEVVEVDETWRRAIKSFDDSNIDTIVSSLDHCFNVIRDIIINVPQLQQEALLELIDKAVSCTNPHANILLKQTLLKHRQLVENDNYMEDLSYELAWAFTTSYDFIKPDARKQWINRKNYLSCLINFWYKKHENGDLDLYRLLDKHYHAYTAFFDIKNKINFKLKPYSDLCDSQMFHYAVFGFRLKEVRSSVISISMAKKGKEAIYKEKHEWRMAVAKQSLIDLQRDVANWGVSATPGEVVILVVNDDNSIDHGHRIPFNAPIGKQYSKYVLFAGIVFIGMVLIFVFYSMKRVP